MPAILYGHAHEYPGAMASGTAPLPWAPVGNSAWPESRQQRELRCGKGSDCGNLPEP